MATSPIHSHIIYTTHRFRASWVLIVLRRSNWVNKIKDFRGYETGSGRGVAWRSWYCYLVWVSDWLGFITSKRLGLRSLDQAVIWARQHKNREGFQCSVYKLLLLLLYIMYVWLERNARIFENWQRDACTVVSVMNSDLRDCLSSWRRIKRSAKNRALCAQWNISPCTFAPCLHRCSVGWVSCPNQLARCCRCFRGLQ